MKLSITSSIVDFVLVDSCMDASVDLVDACMLDKSCFDVCVNACVLDKPSSLTISMSLIVASIDFFGGICDEDMDM